MNTSCSDIANDTFITTIETKDGVNLYVKLLWKQNENDVFHIKIFDGTSSWSGRYSNAFAKPFLKRFEDTENEEEYYENVKKALIRQDSNIVYVFKPVNGDSNCFEFSWKRWCNKVRALHGSVPVHRDENQESKDTLIDYLLQENGNLRCTVAEYEKKNVELNNDLQKCKDELERFVNIKTSLEETLYGKFVQLLNTKKRRIQLLEENLQKFENTSNHPMDTELD